MTKSPNKTTEDAEEGTDVDKKENKKPIEDEYPKKPHGPYPGFKKNFTHYFSEYSSNTGIHGFMYMADHDRTIIERLWWLVLFCISMYICMNLIIESYIKWDTSPVLVSFAKSPTPVWQIPFPAVTICSVTKAKQSEYNFTEKYYMMEENPENMTDEEQKQYAAMALNCGNNIYTEGNLTMGYDSIAFLMKVAPSLPDMFLSCDYMSFNDSCEQLFTPILTDEGLCYTFNMLDRSELFRNKVFLPGAHMSNGKKSEGWTLEAGYPKHTLANTYPTRALSAGLDFGLTVILINDQKDTDYLCNGVIQGFKIVLHSPSETPRLGKQYIRAPLNQEVTLAVKPDMMTTSDSLKGYDAKKRHCYFPQERQLAFFQTYTQQNCEVECITNFTKAKCGCVAYHMPHEEGIPLCGTANIYCMHNAQKELLNREIQSELSREESIANGISKCDCLPGCTSLVYNAETSQADFDMKNFMLAMKLDESSFSDFQLTTINIFFKEQQFITSERNELFGQTDFVANVGGLLGLFTGFSFLSIVEIIYFLSLRIICNIKKYGRHYWSGSPELVNNDRYIHPK